MRTYDTTFVLDGRITAEEREALIERFSGVLEKLGGTMDRIVRWGMRPLAYEINKRSRGYYVIFYHNSEPEIIRPFERDLGLSEYVLRYMTLVWDGVHPSYIHDEGQHAEAGELPAEIVDKVEAEEDAVVEADGEEVVTEESAEEDAGTEEEAPVKEAAEEEAEEAVSETKDDSGDTEAAPEEASATDDTDDSAKEAE